MTTSERFSRPGKDEYIRILGACAQLERDPSEEGNTAAVTAYGPKTVACAVQRRERLAFLTALAAAPEPLKRTMQSADLLMQLEEISRHFTSVRRVPLLPSAIDACFQNHMEESESAKRMLDHNHAPEGVLHALASHSEEVVDAVLSVRFYTLQTKIKQQARTLDPGQRENVKTMLALFSNVESSP